MFWITLTLALASGAATALVARLIFRRTNWTRNRYFSVFLVGAILFWIFVDDSVTPLIRARRYTDSSVVEEELRAVPYYALLARYDPAEGRAVRDRIQRILLDPAHNDLMLHAAAARIGGELFVKYLPRASDSSVVDYLRAQSRILRALQERDSDACYAYIRKGSTAAAIIHELASPGLFAADSSAMFHVIESGMQTPPAPHDTARADLLLQQSYVALAGPYPDYDRLLSDTSVATRAKLRYCQMVIALYIHIIALPPHDAALAARRMMVGRGS